MNRTVAPHWLEESLASPHESVGMALFCDFEKIVLGVRDESSTLIRFSNGYC
jgi:hypothetical protein